MGLIARYYCKTYGFGLKKNEANDTNFHDGYYWTFNSSKAFKTLFPYLSQRQIETALKKLRDEELIITGNYNVMKYDRTLWYAITEKGKCILHSCEMDFTLKGNGNDENVKPIPYRNTNKKPNNNINNNSFIPPTLEEVEAYCKSRNSKIDPKHFFEHYNVADWVDKNGKSIQNWKQKVITWEKHNDNTRNNKQGKEESSRWNIRYSND